jgi:hypothetical protein
MRAMALGDGPQATSASVEQLGRKRLSNISPQRDSLIKKGLIYAPDHALVDFTAPSLPTTCGAPTRFSRRKVFCDWPSGRHQECNGRARGWTAAENRRCTVLVRLAQIVAHAPLRALG